MQTSPIPPNIAHIKQLPDGTLAYQSNEAHCQSVAHLAQRFASEFGMGEWGYILGLLHDKGKEKPEFQDYIRCVNGIPGHTNWTHDGKAHAYVGALLARKAYPGFADAMVNQLAGHHAGLYDYTELQYILQQPLPEGIVYDGAAVRPSVEKLKNIGCQADFHHLFRMLYSCLVDADYLDTEAFMNSDASRLRTRRKTLAELLPMLEERLRLMSEKPQNPVNAVRQRVQQQCRKAAALQPGCFSLTVPTGGGKTLSSLVWALRHAVCHGLRRIVIAIPYTSIIVQTAGVLRDIFGEENVLEHHSDADPDEIHDPLLRRQMKLATENWDYPIVVTTNVRLFESMYACSPSACRKLHNLCHSVLILDEVQTLPTGYLQPIVDALKSYQHLFGISILLTTASQPILSGEIQGCNPKASFPGIRNIHEIIPDDFRLHEALRRVTLEIDRQGSTYDDIAERLARHDRVLCIVNTRRDAQELFNRLPQEGITLHLSRMMCPAHIRQTIEEIKQALGDASATVIRVVATQLIEAGVDIDFPVVYRQEAGLDSVLQAAGRCNREGLQPLCTTHVFSLSAERPLPRGHISAANDARRNIVGEPDWFAPATMTEYFRQYYCRQQSFDAKGIAELLYRPQEMCFKQAAREFRLIEDSGVGIIVNFGDSLAMVKRLKQEGPSYSLLKQLAQYTVSVHRRDFERLRGILTEEIEGIYVARDREQYSPAVGLTMENHWLEEILIK